MVSVTAETAAVGRSERAGAAVDLRMRLLILAAWILLFASVAVTHVVWRDEVRALSIALSAETWQSLFEAVRPEGHPMLWYLLLKGAYAIVGDPVVLQGLAAVVAASAMVLFVLRAPFPPALLALYAFSFPVLFDLGVLARNYGISALLMIIAAGLISEPRRNAVGIAVTLALLANTNVHSAVLAAAFAGLWMVALLPDRPTVRDVLSIVRKPVVWGVLAVTGLGILACFLTVYPPKQDYFGSPAEWTGLDVLLAIVDPGRVFPIVSSGILPSVANSLILFAAVAGLWRTPLYALLVLAVFALFGVMFTVLYTGFYRHQALAIVAAVAITWVAASCSPRRPSLAGLAVLVGSTFLFNVWQYWPKLDLPFSMSRMLCQTVLARPDLKDSVLMSEPQWLMEPLPYYCSNPVYLPREERYGAVSYFARDRLKPDYSLAALTADADRIRRETGRPVIVALPHDLDLDRVDQPFSYWKKSGKQLMTFHVDAQSAAAFRARTSVLMEPREVFLSDEKYRVFVFN